MIELKVIPKTDPHLKEMMADHYSHPKGFVGRSICYSINVNNKCYGAIIAGSATKHLPGRNQFIGKEFDLNMVVNNIFFHCYKVDGKYPFRCFTEKVIRAWREREY